MRAPLFQEVRYKVHDPKAHSKGGTLENTINGRADEEAPPPPPGLMPAQKDPNKVSLSENILDLVSFYDFVYFVYVVY